MNTKLCSLKYTPNTAAAVAVKVVSMRFMKKVITEEMELITMLGMLILEMASMETFAGLAPARLISWFQCLLMKKATDCGDDLAAYGGNRRAGDAHCREARGSRRSKWGRI